MLWGLTDQLKHNCEDGMKLQSVLIVTLDEAKEALIQFWADVLADRPNVVELLHEGKLDIPNIAAMDAEKVANQYGDLCLGDKLLERDRNVDLVVIRVGEWTYECAADRTQMHCPAANAREPSN